MDAMSVRRAIFAGYDWGGRAACVGAALWPERCAGLVSVNSYLIQDIARSMVPARPERELAIWYQYYFHSERGRAGLAAYRRDIAAILWKQWSPPGSSTRRHSNGPPRPRQPDFVDIAIHSYRHRLGWPPAIRGMPISSAAWPRCPRSRCRQSPWTAMRTAWRRQPLQYSPRRDSPVPAPTVSCVAPVTICRRRAGAFAGAVMELVAATVALTPSAHRRCARRARKTGARKSRAPARDQATDDHDRKRFLNHCRSADIAAGSSRCIRAPSS